MLIREKYRRTLRHWATRHWHPNFRAPAPVSALPGAYLLYSGLVLTLLSSLLAAPWSLATAYEAIEVQNGGTIAGTVTLAGPAPPAEQL